MGTTVQDITPGEPERDRLENRVYDHIEAMEQDLRELARAYGMRLGILAEADETGLHTLVFGEPSPVVRVLHQYMQEALERVAQDPDIMAELRRLVGTDGSENDPAGPSSD
jgi:hypothetical protein